MISWWRGAWWAFAGALAGLGLAQSAPRWTVPPVTDCVQTRAGIAGVVLGVLWMVCLAMDLREAK